MHKIKLILTSISILVTLVACGSKTASVTGTPTVSDGEFLISSLLPNIIGVDTNQSLVQDAATDGAVTAGQPSTITIIGTDLSGDMVVKLGPAKCALRDLGPFENAEKIDVPTEVIYADCPAVAAGTYSLEITDLASGENLNTSTITAVSQNIEALRIQHIQALRPRYTEKPYATEAQAANAIIKRMAAYVSNLPMNSYVNGCATFQAPTINTSTGGLNFGTLVTKPIRGVVVNLLDADQANAIIATTATDSSGCFAFGTSTSLTIPTGDHVIVQLSAQISATRASGVTTGPQYNFMLRDNTSTGDIKTLYTKSSPSTLTAAGLNTINLVAATGYDATGNVNGTRESAPFSILDVIYNAVSGITTADPNVSLADLNIYWSPDNVPTSGDKTKGLIGTSHFANNGTYPGVFILGKADVDTDEFDRGVIGHEFGHYLQFVASYSDNPGGSHSSNQFKDASLAYGEGFGTAIGGLLSQSQYYTDSSGPQSASGGATDISQALSSPNLTGFYSENSVAHLLYTIGTTNVDGSKCNVPADFSCFSRFWLTTTHLKDDMASATVFKFLYIFNSQNPTWSSRLNTLALADNIRTLDEFGVLSGDSDPLLSTTASGGATDLETLYYNLSINNWDINSTTSASITNTPPKFCINNKLTGANDSNGLGMSRRFKISNIPQAGAVGLRLVDSAGNPLPTGNFFVTVRDNSGTKIPLYVWNNDIGFFNATANNSYSFTLNFIKATAVVGGNQCGVSLIAMNAV